MIEKIETGASVNSLMFKILDFNELVILINWFFLLLTSEFYQNLVLECKGSYISQNSYLHYIFSYLMEGDDGGRRNIVDNTYNENNHTCLYSPDDALIVRNIFIEILWVLICETRPSIRVVRVIFSYCLRISDARSTSVTE